MIILNTAHTAGRLAWTLEGAEAHAHRISPPRGKWMVPLLQLLIGAAAMVARELDQLND
jgi:hypothetical protein